MSNEHSDGHSYVFAAFLGAMVGGIIIVLAMKAFPGIMAQMKSKMDK